MPRLFISHSNQDNFEAIAFHDWLIREGWAPDDVFLDLHDINAGAKWKEALATANERCEAIVFLASPASLASTECRLEIRMAEDYGKEIIVAIVHSLKVDDEALGLYRGERQIVDLSAEPRDATFTVEHKGQRRAVSFSGETLRRIKARLDQLGISPTTFSWRPGDLETASPYPGFEGFTQHDAALFFGRAGDIARGLAEVRKLRRFGTGQVMVIQAASGAGKSSFLRAGLWPRLERDPEILPVAILRPATGILTGDHGVGRQLASYFATHRSPRTATEIHQALRGSPEKAAEAFLGLINEATKLGYAVNSVARPDAQLPTPVFGVDQAEELFAVADQEESQKFLEIIARVMAAKAQGSEEAGQLLAAPLFVWTIRADSVDALLHATERVGLRPPDLFPLPPIPRDAYREIIEAPLAVANQAGMRVTIDPLLVDALVENSSGADALPLLAFALRQLLAENRTGATARLTLDLFLAAGGMDGILSKRQALAQRSAGSGPTDLRRLFIPHLATWDEDAEPPGAKRLVAEEDQLIRGERERLKALADALVEARLLTRSGTRDGRSTLEVAHEALLRLPPLSEWLENDREFLSFRDRLSKSRGAYEANTRGLLVGRELQIARDWLDSRADAHDISEPDKAFIAASLEEEGRRRTEEEERERRRREAELAAANAREEAAEAAREVAAQRAAIEQQRAEAAALQLHAAQRIARRTFAGAGAALVLAILAGGASYLAWTTLQQNWRTQSDSSTRIASDFRSQHNASEAMAVALSALPSTQGFFERPISPPALVALREARYERRELRVLPKHPVAVSSVAFSPDGKLIATGADDNLIRIWRVGDGTLVRTIGGDEGLEGDRPRINSIGFSPDGRLIVSGSAGSKAALWDVSSGDEVAELSGHGGGVTSVSFSRDGKHVLTASRDRVAIVWDATGSSSEPWVAATTIVPQLGAVTAAAFDPTGNRVLLGFENGEAGIWRADGGERLIALEKHGSAVSSVAYSNDGNRLLTASYDKTLKVFDGTGQTLIARLVGHQDKIYSAGFSPDGTRLISASADSSIRIWDASDLLDATKEAELVVMRSRTQRVLAAAYSPDGKLILAGSSDGTARLWDAVGAAEVPTFDGRGGIVQDARFVAGAGRIVTASDDGVARIWEVASGALVLELRGHGGKLLAIDVSPDGRYVVTASEDKTARIWDAETGEPKAILRPGANNESGLEAASSLSADRERVTAAVFSPNGRYIITTMANGRADLWDASTAEHVTDINIGTVAHITHAVFSPDSQHIALGTNNGGVAVWDVGSRTMASNWQAACAEGLCPKHEYSVSVVAYDPTGSWVLSGGQDNRAFVSDAVSGRVLTRLDNSAVVQFAAVSPSGAQIALGLESGAARIFEPKSGKLLFNLSGHDRRVRSVAFSPDETTILTASDDMTARIYDAHTGKCLAVLRGHTEALSGARFSSDGHWMLTASGDGTARAWPNWTTSSLVGGARDIVARLGFADSSK